MTQQQPRTKMSRLKRMAMAGAGSGGATFIVGFGAAAVHSVRSDAFGLGDLYRFTYWHIPFSLAMALVALTFAALTGGRPALYRLAVAPLAAAGAGVLLAGLVEMTLAPSFRAFGLPVLFFWILGAVAGVYVAVAMLWRRGGPHREEGAEDA